MVKEVVRRLVKLTIQAVLVLFAFNLAVYFLHGGSWPSQYVSDLMSIYCLLLVAKLASFAAMHLLSTWWRYTSLHDLIQLIKANLLGTVLFAVCLKVWPLSLYRVSESLIILDGLLCFLFTAGFSVAIRLCRESMAVAHKNNGNGRERILIVGAGAAGQSIAREIKQNPHLNWKVLGFVDQEEKRIRQTFQGIPVLATISGLDSLLKTLPVDHVLLANSLLNHKELRHIVELCRKHNVKSKILPNVESILNGKVSIHHVRDVNLEDLLGRPSVNLDVGSIKNYLHQKSILVSGAAGSIGSEICRQVARFGPSKIILLDNSETPLFNIDRELKQAFPDTEFVTRLGDVCDSWLVNHLFDTCRPEVVFHAAAYKHVPLSELNPLAAIGNNVIGTLLLAKAAKSYRSKNFVMVSTDKAVNPTNIMGASKRAAEVYVQALAQQSQLNMVTVRFGNVLGSNGSVVPIFQEQIRNGGPVTVTDPEVTRYFMTISEAAQLVLQAGSMGHGGEIFVLDMGEQINIMRLAEELIRLSGMVPNRDIDIAITGLRPGEKLHEELFHDSEGLLQTSHEKICVARSMEHDLEQLEHYMEEMIKSCQKINTRHALSLLQAIVPDYVPESKPKPLKTVIFAPQKINSINLPRNVVKTA